jgi:hypothetical protein
VQNRELVIQAVLMALWQRHDRTPVYLHSDRGRQFTSDEYQRFLKGHNLVCSMSAVGSCADNALVERFFGMLKRERVNRRHYYTCADARADIFDYVNSTIRGCGVDWKSSGTVKIYLTQLSGNKGPNPSTVAARALATFFFSLTSAGLLRDPCRL